MTEREEQILHLIVKHSSQIEKYLSKIDSVDDFFANELVMDGVVVRVEDIGELVKRLSPDFRAEFEQVEKDMGYSCPTNWRGLAGIRDFIAHQYDNLNFDIVYDTAIVEIPQLKAVCEYLLAEKCKIDS